MQTLFFKRIDLRVTLIILGLMIVSLLTLSTTSLELEEPLMTRVVTQQMQWFALGWGFFLFFSWLDYHQLRKWAWPLYIGTLCLLVGLFFVPTIQHVHRWYRLFGVSFQPSEYAKLVLVIVLSWFLEYKERRAGQIISAIQAMALVFIPFILIVKQPDLGTAMILFPIALMMFYFGGIHRAVVKAMSYLALLGLTLLSLFFLKVIPHEELRPYATKILKEYQYERLSPDTYHQEAAETAIALGGLTGAGWRQSEFSGNQWLPAASTDSIFPTYAEAFGLTGVMILLSLFFGLIYCSFQVTAVAKDVYGRLLSAGITVYLAVHVLVNMAMMCGFLPITGVPLILVSYGGTSTLATMTALGILQSIYSRRFTF